MKGPKITVQKDDRILLLSSITDLCQLLNLKGCFASESLGEPGADQSLHSAVSLGNFFIYLWGSFFPHGLLTTGP